MVFMQGLWGEAEWNKEPDGATAQEVYNTAKYVFNHQTGSDKEPAVRPEPARHLEDEDKCLGKGQNGNTRSAPPGFGSVNESDFYWPPFPACPEPLLSSSSTFNSNQQCDTNAV